MTKKMFSQNINKYKFKINENIEVALEDEGVYYKTIVQEVSEDHLIIGVPILKREALVLYKGDRIIIKIIREDAVYFFSSEIKDRLKGDNVPLYILNVPQLMERLQRRGHVRVPCMLPTYYRVYPKHEEGDNQQAVGDKSCYLVGETVDISGGGIKLVSVTEMAVGQNVEIMLKLPHRVIKAVGQVITVKKVSYSRSKSFPIQRISLKFIQITEQDREEIIAFIFKKLREWM